MIGSEWRKSSFSGTNGCVEVKFVAASGCANNSCVQVARTPTVVLLRDSKQPDGPRLSFSHHEWQALLDGVRAGEFDLQRRR